MAPREASAEYDSDPWNSNSAWILAVFGIRRSIPVEADAVLTITSSTSLTGPLDTTLAKEVLAEVSAAVTAAALPAAAAMAVFAPFVTATNVAGTNVDSATAANASPRTTENEATDSIVVYAMAVLLVVGLRADL
jgi:hypothetical protein